MKKPLVIFGLGDIAQLAHFYFNSGSEYQVVAFTVDAGYLIETTFCNLPVVAYENVTNIFPPEQFEFFIAIGYTNINSVRKEKYLSTKAKGYRMASYISPHAVVLNNGQIGDNCLIFEGNTIQPFVTIGNNVILASGNNIAHHAIIHDHCFISSHVIVAGHVEIGEQCFIGVNATLRNHIKIGEKCIIGAGTLLLADAAPEGLYIGDATERSNLSSTKLKTI